LATHKSAMKRDRQSKVRRQRNRKVRSKVRTSTKNVISAVESGDSESASSQLRDATKVISKAASKGVLKKKTASRKVSRLAKHVNKINAGA